MAHCHLHTRSAFLKCPCPMPSNSYLRTWRHRRVPTRRGTVAIGAVPSSSVASLAGQDIPRPSFIYLLPFVVLQIDPPAFFNPYILYDLHSKPTNTSNMQRISSPDWARIRVRAAHFPVRHARCCAVIWCCESGRRGRGGCRAELAVFVRG
jgi:hypothetical protein